MGRIAERWQENPVNNNNIWISYGYDGIGDEISRNFNSLTYAAQYDGAGRLTSFTQTDFTDANNPANLLSGATYDAFGDLDFITYGNGLSRSWRYDNRGRLTASAVGTGCAAGTGTCTNTKYSYSVGYAPNGDVWTANDSVNGIWTYTYDDFNRLASSSMSGGPSYTYAYDRYGNMWHGDGTLSLGFSGGNNRIDGLSYDAAGNVLNDGVHSYAYDAENRLASVDDGATTYTYDAMGHRVAKASGGAVTDFIYDREGHLILYTPATPTFTELYVAGMHVTTSYMNSTHTGTTAYFAHADWLGTERARTDPTGAVAETCQSLPFGDGLSCTGASDVSPMHFTGKEHDTESTLDYFGARYNSSSLGRFMSPDPLGIQTGQPGDPQGLNLYSYVENNPVNAVDPDGLDCVFIQNNAVWDACGDCTGIKNGTYIPGTVDKNSATYDPNTGTLNLSWPEDHIGWRLQSQTNVIALGLSNNGADVVGSSNVDQVSIPVDPNQGAVFFRLIYP